MWIFEIIKFVIECDYMKIRFYLISLIPLFVLIFFLALDIPISFAANASFIGFWPLIQRNIVSLISLCMLVISLYFVCKMRYEWKGVYSPPYEIISIKNENYEYLSFLTTCIIPLICFKFDSVQYLLALVFLIIVIGKIVVKMDLYYGNPTLALFGYKLYKVEVKGENFADGIILISLDDLNIGDNIDWKKVGEYVWVARKHG